MTTMFRARLRHVLRAASHVRPRVAAALALLLGAALAILGAARLDARNHAEATRRFDVLAEHTAAAVGARMERYQYGLRGTRGAVVAAGGERFARACLEDYNATRDFGREFPGALGIGVIRRVAEGDEAAFVAGQQRTRPGFRIRQLEPHAGERFVTEYLDPEERNRAAIGFDVASETDRRSAALASMRTGAATLTGPITLLQATGARERSFSLLLPMYRPGARLDSTADREAAAFGWTIAPLVFEDVMSGLDVSEDNLVLVLRDVTDATPQTFFTSASNGDVDARFLRVIELPIYGRRWAAEFHATPAFAGNLAQSESRLVGIAGVALSSLLAAIVFLATRGLRRAREALAEQARRAAIVDSSSDGIIGESLDGIITDWNEGARRLFGYTREQALGRTAVSLLHPPGLEYEDIEIRAEISLGESVQAFDTTRRRADGTLVDVSVTASPIIAADGRRFGFSKTLRDVTETRRTQRALAELNAQLEHQVAERTARLDAVVHDLESIVAAVPSTIGYWDRGLVNRMANRRYGEMFGRDAASMPGLTLRELVGDELFDQNIPRAEGALRGEPQAFELSLPGVAGDVTRHLLVRFVPDRVNDDVRGFYAFTHDVTELVESRLQLAAAQRDASGLLRTIHEHAIVSVADRAGRILEVNDSFCRISGYSREQLVGKNHRVVNSGVHGQAFWREVWAVISSGRSWRGDICNRAADGSLYWVDSIISPYVGDDGRVEKYISIRTDITARKVFAEDLRATNERFELAAEVAGFGVWTYAGEAGAVAWDANTFTVFGRTCAGGESARAVWESAVVEADRARRDEETMQAIAGARAFDLEFRITSPTGVRHIKSNARVQRDANGRAIRMIGVHMDVTERKNAEIALRGTSSLLTTVLASASEVSIIATDPNLVVTVFNKGAERLLGYTSAEIVGLTTPALVHDAVELRARASKLSADLGRRVVGAAVFTEPSTLGQAREWTYVRKDGARIPVSLVITEMRDADDELFGYLGVAHDVTAQQQAERSLRQAVHKAKSANRAKSQFLANMSHEIRTPMNAVLGLSYLLEKTPLDAEQASLLYKIRLSSKSLLGIINDILDLSKIEAAELKIERAPVDLAKLIEDQSDVMGTQAQAKGIGFAIDAPAGLPTVESDAVRLNQILTNLLSNAIKFTDRGNVTLRAAVVAAAANSVRVRFAVEDSGIGIAAETLPTLFSPFAQADASTTRRFGGTGLGLSIVKQLVSLLGGEMGVESASGVGSTFWVELDFTLSNDQSRLAASQEPAHHGPGLPGVRVLVADDSDINLEVARRVLELEGAAVSLARNGQEVIDQLTASPRGFDAILLDVQMPVLDGHDTTRHIRDVLGLKDLPIIALTAGTLTSEAALAEAAGMNAFVGKPFEPAALVRCIRRLVGVAAVREPLLRSTPAAAAPQDWPLIDGIDAEDAYLRLRDRELFRALLQRFLDDFTDLRDLADVTSSDRRKALAARLHDLKGMAGTLGARALQACAGAAEAACRAGDDSLAGASTLDAATELDSLRKDAAPFLLELRRVEECTSEEGAYVDDLTMDDEALMGLIGMLRASNFAATGRFEELARPLRAMLGPDAYERIKRQLEDLKFGAVAAALDERRLTTAGHSASP